MKLRLLAIIAWAMLVVCAPGQALANPPAANGAAEAAADLSMKKQQYYEDARARADSAESIMADALKGVAILNGAGIGLILTALGLHQPNGGSFVKFSVTKAKTAVSFLIWGVAFGTVGMALFAASTFFRGYFEFYSAQHLFFGSKDTEDENIAALFSALYVGSLVISVAAAMFGLGSFIRGARAAVDAAAAAEDQVG